MKEIIFNSFYMIIILILFLILIFFWWDFVCFGRYDKLKVILKIIIKNMKESIEILKIECVVV